MRICRLCNSIISDGMQFCEECGAKSVIYDNAQYTLDGCPLVLVEQNLMLDEEGTKIVLLFVVNGTQTVNACNITLKCYDQLGDVVADTVVKYNDLCVEKGELFGSGKIIVPMDSDTRKFDVLINKVLLDDGTLWKSEELCQKVGSMAEFSDLLKHHNEELVEDKKREEREKREKACVELWNKIVKMDFVDEKFEVGKREEFKKLALNIDSIISQYPDFIIPEGVRKIPKRAFCDLQCLRSIEIPGTVQCIGREFWGCSNIEKIIIHEGVQEIEALALFLSIISELGHKLKLVDLPSTIKKIGERAIPWYTNTIILRCDVDVNHIISYPSSGAVERCSNLVDENFVQKIYCVNPQKVFSQLQERKKSVSDFGGMSTKVPPIEVFPLEEYGKTPEEIQEMHEKARTAEQKKQERIQKYWSEHLDEKLALEAELKKLNAEKDDITAKIDQRNKEFLNLNNQIIMLSKERIQAVQNNTPKKSEISELYRQLNKLGMFKGKQKKELREQISALESEASNISIKIEAEIAEKEEKVADNRKSIESLKYKLNIVSIRIDEIMECLTKER